MTYLFNFTALAGTTQTSAPSTLCIAPQLSPPVFSNNQSKRALGKPLTHRSRWRKTNESASHQRIKYAWELSEEYLHSKFFITFFKILSISNIVLHSNQQDFYLQRRNKTKLQINSKRKSLKAKQIVLHNSLEELRIWEAEFLRSYMAGLHGSTSSRLQLTGLAPNKVPSMTIHHWCLLFTDDAFHSTHCTLFQKDVSQP